MKTNDKSSYLCYKLHLCNIRIIGYGKRDACYIVTQINKSKGNNM